ncbi:MAG: DNA polymerase III subunit chi [Rickettsiales bacterium]|nr:DNA polymerase III subunit chi [Rickettsiales bacterium]
MISFYQLSSSPIEQALPVLLEKILSTGNRAVLLCKNKDLLKELDKSLWAVGGTRFLPHGTEDEDFKAEQPIYLTSANDNPNGAKFLVNIGILDDDFYQNFERTLVIFNQADKQETDNARKLWKALKSNENLILKFFKQNEKGSWEES